MAQQQQKGGRDSTPKPAGGNTPRPGGNTPKPAGGNTPRPGGNTQAAKDRSRAQSRPVSAKSPGGKPGKGGSGGNTRRPGGRPVPTPAPRGLSATMIAWGSVALVVIVIAVFVIIKATGGSSTATTAYTPVTPAPASIVKDVSTVPASVYNKVGVSIPSQATPHPPIVLTGQPPLTLSGRTPAMLYFGAEWCPYCAAERWGIVTALARFGTWTNLKLTASSHTDVYPATPTFSFQGASYSSRYLGFDGIENCTNIPDSANTSCNGYQPLPGPNPQQQAVINKYSSPTFIPGAAAGSVGYPFIDIGNQALISGATYDPQMLAGLTQSEIAANLSDPTNSVTRSIVGTANYISAAICASTKERPSSVCTSPGVTAASKALKLK